MSFSNNRLFFAVYAVGVAPEGSTSYTAIHGLQSVGVTTTFNVEDVLEIGQIEVYEKIEELPDVEVTFEKVLDGYPPIYTLVTQGSVGNSLSNKANERANIAMSVFGDVQDSASGVPLTQVTMSGMYLSSATYNCSVDGNCTESITLVGNDKQWKAASFDFTGTIFDNTDEPLALTSGTGGVQRRENVVFDSDGGAASLDTNSQIDVTDATVLPPDIDGISSSGTNDADSDGIRSSHIQSINTTFDLGRDNLLELGNRSPYHRFVSFPVEVTTEIEVLSQKGDQVDAKEDATNLSNRTIKLKLEEGLFIDLGTRNKLSNVSFGGGDTGGGNATDTYTFTNSSNFTLTHPQAP